jgi:hypothetical protein
MTMTEQLGANAGDSGAIVARLSTAIWRRAFFFLFVAVVVQSLSLAPVQSQTIIDKKSEYNVKAVYLYSFGRYVAWPDDAFASKQSALVIGVLGDNPFGGALLRIAQTKSVQGRSIEIRRFAPGDDCAGCHVLFISNTVPLETQKEVLNQLRDQHVLLVGEEQGFALRGGIISFFIEENTVRFRINVEVAQSHRLSIDGKLLSLAKIVGDAR